MPFTVLRGSAFLEVLRYIVADDGVIRGPGGSGRLAPVARDDLADTAAAVLAADGAYDGKTFDVTGPERLSLEDIAAAFAAASERQISYVEETVDDALASRQGLGAEQWLVEAWVGPTSRSRVASSTSSATRSPGSPATRRCRSRSSFKAHPDNYEHLKAR